MSYGGVEYAGAPYADPRAPSAVAGADPALAVEIAFTSAPGSDSPVWVDVSDYVMEGSTKRGRSQELDSYQAGTATVTLRNEDRRFDPQYASSPFVGNILPMKRIRIRGTYAGVTYPIFDGFIDSWDQRYWDAADTLSTAVVTATDGFKVLSQADLDSSAYAVEVRKDTPAAWYRLNETTGTASLFDSSGNVNTLTVNGVPNFGASSLTVNDSDSAVTFNVNTAGAGKPSRIVTNAPLSIELWYKPQALVGSNIFLAGQAESDAGPGFALQMTGATNYLFAAGAPGSALSFVTSSASFTVGVTQHIVGVWEADGTLRIYINGVDSSSSVVTNVPGAAFAGAFGIGACKFGETQTAAALGTYDEVAVYNKALTAADVARHYAAGTAPWTGDTPAARMNRVLDAIGWPSSQRDLETGSSVLQSATLGGSALDHARKVEQSEFGNLYMAADGKVRLEARTSAVNQPSMLTLDDTTPSSSYTSITFDFSDQLIRNDVTISRSNGTAQRVKDATSIAAYLPHSYTRDGLIHNSDDVSLSAAQLLVSEYKDPLLRVTGLGLAPRGSPSTLFPHVLGRELTDRVTVNRKPQGVGTAISKLCQIEGIEHEFGAKRWVTKWRLSPAFASQGGVFWQLGVAGFSELGTTTRLYF